MSKYDQRSVMILARRYLCPKKYAKSQYPGPWLVGLLLFWALIGWNWLLDYFCSTLQSWIRIDNSWKIKDIIISFDQKRKKIKKIFIKFLWPIRLDQQLVVSLLLMHEVIVYIQIQSKIQILNLKYVKFLLMLLWGLTWKESVELQ